MPLGPLGALHGEHLVCMHPNIFAQTNAQLNQPTLTRARSSFLSHLSLFFSSVPGKAAADAPSSARNLMIVRRHDHQRREMGGKVMTPLLEINTAVQKNLH